MKQGRGRRNDDESRLGPRVAGSLRVQCMQGGGPVGSPMASAYLVGTVVTTSGW